MEEKIRPRSPLLIEDIKLRHKALFAHLKGEFRGVKFELQDRD